jgi:LPXTG-motif cell wall-anchored protein
MGSRRVPRVASAAVTGVTLASVAGLTVLALAVPAWANTTPVLNQTNVYADKNAFGKCTEKPNQSPNEDVWVFVWPGNDAGDLLHLTLNFDSNGDGAADAVRTEDDATKTLDNGTAKWSVTTPAGWKLINGTSEVTGTTSQGKFQLTHSCGGSTSTTQQPSTPPRDGEGDGEGDGDGDGAPGTSVPSNSGGGLPVTGAAVGGAVILGMGLVAVGIALIAVRRRRDVFDSGY